MKGFDMKIAILSMFILCGSLYAETKKSTTPKSQAKISNIEQGSIYQQLGLKDGDVIKKVNGQVPSSMNDLNVMFSKIKKGTKVDLVIERNGKEESFHYSID